MSRPHLWKSKIFKISRFLVIFVLVFAWLYSAWPQIWPLGELGVNKIRIPPKIQEAQAAELIHNSTLDRDFWFVYT